MSALNMDKKVVARFAVLEGIYWGIMGSFGAFLVAWALNRGFSQSFVSILLVIYLVGGFTGQFVLSSLCDRLRTNKSVFILGIILAGISQLGMYFAKNPLVFAIFYGCYGFSLGPMGSILDAWMVRMFCGDMNAYSSARGVGSIGYAVVTLIMGYVIGYFGYHLMPICSTIMVVLTLLIAFGTPDGKFVEGRQGGTANVSVKGVLSIMQIPTFFVVLVVLLLSSMSSAPINNFKIMLLQSVGGDVTTQGLDSFVGCVVQFLVFESTVLFTRVPARVRFAASILLVAIALAVDYCAMHYWVVILGTVFTNVSYGLIMPSVREIAIEVVDAKYHTTAIGMMDAFYSFLGGAVAQLFAGRIAGTYGVKAMVMVCLILSLLPVLILGPKQMAYKGKVRKRCVNKCQGC